MDLTETSLKLSTTPFSINDILTSNNHHQNISKKIKQFCRFRRSSLDCFIVSKDEEQNNVKSTDSNEKNIVQLLNSNPIDMRRRHNMSGKLSCFRFNKSVAIKLMTLEFTLVPL